MRPLPQPALPSPSLMKLKHALRVALLLSLAAVAPFAYPASLVITHLRCEYLENPLGIDAVHPRLSWQLRSEVRGAAQTAWQIRVASSAEKLSAGNADLWDSGKVQGNETNQIVYGGRPLASRQECHWQVRVWDEAGRECSWSAPATWTVGLLSPNEWTAAWITSLDELPPPQKGRMDLPSAVHFRRDFQVRKPIRRAFAYASALGLYDLFLNGQRVDEAYFLPGWVDYRQRGYYRTHDVTALLSAGDNAIGAVLADGWYAGYVGFGALFGYGANASGRNIYGKKPALLVQLEIEYTDGTRETIVTDRSWEYTTNGPTREADIIMGESYDARAEMPGWSKPRFNSATWQDALLARDTPSLKAVFRDSSGLKEREIGFVAPPRLEAYAAPAIHITEELQTVAISEPSPGTYIFDLGQNFAGVVRLTTRGKAGTQLRLRYGEMLHPDGRLMTENLRSSRSTDFYTLKGDPAGETWTARFTYHGFRYVEITGLAERPSPQTITGLVLHNATAPAGRFECSDPVMTRFALNAWWTQRANFVEVPTDCPQRDERLGWTGDAQIYMRTATYFADVSGFFTNWLRTLRESQHSFGAYPPFAPLPFAHGRTRGKSFASGWSDAGVICTWTQWKVYGDRAIVAEMWPSLTRYMEWRLASTDTRGLGVSQGTPWADWLNVNEPTPVEFIDTCYHALTTRMMGELAGVMGIPLDVQNYQGRFEQTQRAFANEWITWDGKLRVDTQTAYVLALESGILPARFIPTMAAELARKVTANRNHMATGFLGTRSILAVLTENGHHDLAVRLFQNRTFPSWGYEVVNGATTVWERWDSWTKEHGFDGLKGDQNASMNSFNHYAFGAVMQWAFEKLAGIETAGVGFREIVIHPRPPTTKGEGDWEPISWVTAEYDSINGPIASSWRVDGDAFHLQVKIPANVTAQIILPPGHAVREGGRSLVNDGTIQVVSRGAKGWVLQVKSGSYDFVVDQASPPAGT